MPCVVLHSAFNIQSRFPWRHCVAKSDGGTGHRPSKMNSFQQLLAPWSSRGEKRKAGRSPSHPEVLIHLPAHGAVVVSPGMDPDGPGWTSPSFHLKGELEVRLPSSYTPVRCRGIRYVFRGYSTRDMGTGRRGETDVFFETTVEPDMLRESTMEEGSNR